MVGIGCCAIAENFQGQVDTLYRDFDYSARQAVQRWGDAGINIARVNARQLIETLVSDYFSRHEGRIEIDVPDDVFLNVDEARITLLLKNLVSNALRYTSPSDGPVRIEAEN